MNGLTVKGIEYIVLEEVLRETRVTERFHLKDLLIEGITFDRVTVPALGRTLRVDNGWLEKGAYFLAVIPPFLGLIMFKGKSVWIPETIGTYAWYVADACLREQYQDRLISFWVDERWEMCDRKDSKDPHEKYRREIANIKGVVTYREK